MQATIPPPLPPSRIIIIAWVDCLRQARPEYKRHMLDPTTTYIKYTILVQINSIEINAKIFGFEIFLVDVEFGTWHVSCL